MLNPIRPVSPFSQAAISADTRAVNARLAATVAAFRQPEALADLRVAYAGGHTGVPAEPASPAARELSIPGPGGAVGLRVLAAGQVEGVYRPPSSAHSGDMPGSRRSAPGA